MICLETIDATLGLDNSLFTRTEMELVRNRSRIYLEKDHLLPGYLRALTSLEILGFGHSLNGNCHHSRVEILSLVLASFYSISVSQCFLILKMAHLYNE